MRFKKITEVLIEGSYKSYKMLFYLSAVVIVTFAVSVILLRKNTTLGGFIEGVSVESVGMLFDIFVLGFIFNYFCNRGEKKRERQKAEMEKQLKIDRYLEEIDDYRGWDEKEAMYRIVGNIKRLIKLGQRKLPLNNCFLREARLSGVKFETANFWNVNLQEADLFGADLQEAVLLGAYLQRADFRSANLQKIWLTGANLQGAKLSHANLQEANLQETDFQGANFLGAILRGASLHDADLRDVDFSEAKGLTIKMLLNARTLYNIKGLVPELKKKLIARKPELFEKPKEPVS